MALSGSRFAAVLLAVAGCSGGTTGPADIGPCTVSSVAVSVSGGTTPTFTWTPACRVIVLLVEQGATDQWLLEATGDGIASGTTYEVILFGGTEDDPVMLALREFTP